MIAFGEGTPEIIRIPKPSLLSAILGTNQLGVKSIFILALLVASGLAAEKARMEIGLERSIAEHAGAIGKLLAIHFGVLVLVMAIPGAILLDGKSTELRLTGAGLGYVLLALWLWHCGVASLVFACSFSWTFGSLTHFISGGLIGGMGLKLLPMASQSFSLAKRHMMRSAEDLLRVARRRPILYLRSFSDDDHVSTEELQRDYDTGQAFNLSFYTDQRPRRMEEMLCAGLGEVAPVVALERPGDSLPPLGAARLSVGTGDWKAMVDQLITASYFVVLVVAETGGVQWEFDRLVTSGRLSRTLLVLPTRSDPGETWGAFLKRSIHRSFLPSFEKMLPTDALAIALKVDRTPVVFAGSSSPNAYQQIARWMCFQSGSVSNRS